MTEVITGLPESSVSVETQSAPTFRERLRNGAREAYSLLDLSAGVALARTDIRAARETMGHLDDRYDGLLQRQSTDIISLTLQDDILLDFRRDAQRAGFTDVDTMPADQRMETAEGVAASYLDEIRGEFESLHPEWTAEELDAAAQIRAQDIITLLLMDSEARDTYDAAMFEYQQNSASLEEAQADLAELRLQRSERLARIGTIALGKLVDFSQNMRNVPYSAGARVTGMMTTVREWYTDRSPEGKKTMWYTAAGVAAAGLVAYISTRHTGAVPNQAHHEYVLSSVDVPVPSNKSGAHPATLGNAANHPNSLGGTAHPASLGVAIGFHIR